MKRKKRIHLAKVPIHTKDKQVALADIASTYAWKLASLLENEHLIPLFEEALPDDIALMETLGIRELFEAKLVRYVSEFYLEDPQAIIVPRN